MLRYVRDPHSGEKFNTKKLLGNGAFGKVYQASDGENKTVALKMTPKERLSYNAGCEQRILSKIQDISHVNLIEVYDLFTFHLRKPYLVCVMEYCNGGDLKSYMENHGTSMPFATKIQIIGDIASGLQELHSHEIIHRDLKPANVMLDYDEDGKFDAKIGDFVSREYFSGGGVDYAYNDECGTVMYAAPEMITGQRYGRRIDIWSLGVIVYKLFSGENNIQGCLIADCSQREINSSIQKLSRKNDRKTDLLRRMLKINSDLRIGADEVLEHRLLDNY